MKHYKLVEFFFDFGNVEPPAQKQSLPIENFLATVRLGSGITSCNIFQARRYSGEVIHLPTCCNEWYCIVHQLVPKICLKALLISHMIV